MSLLDIVLLTSHSIFRDGFQLYTLSYAPTQRTSSRPSYEMQSSFKWTAGEIPSSHYCCPDTIASNRNCCSNRREMGIMSREGNAKT